VEFTGNIGGRHDNDKGPPLVVYLRSKVALLKPAIIPLVFYPAWLIGTRYFGHF
jgi:hypothetical protein